MARSAGWLHGIAFFVIASDPKQYRPMMISALMEKLLWVLALIVLYLQGRLNSGEVAGATIPHGLLGALFVVAFFKTAREGQSVTS